MTNKEKKQAWSKLSVEFNKSRDDLRADEQLSACWKTLKRNAREYHAKLRKENYSTGGGPRKVKENALYDAVLRIITVSAEGLRNPFDCDALPQDVENLFMRTDENSTPAEVWEYLKAAGAITTWKTYKPNDLKSPLSEPLARNVELVLDNAEAENSLLKMKTPLSQLPLRTHTDSEQNTQKKTVVKEPGENIKHQLNCGTSVSGTLNDTMHSFCSSKRDDCNEHKPLYENKSDTSKSKIDLLPLYKEKTELEIQLLQKQIKNEELRMIFLRQRNLRSSGDSANSRCSSLSFCLDDEEDEGY